LKSETPPRIAGRCTVFAKTDMIHLQQEATPDYDIIAGLWFCRGQKPQKQHRQGQEHHSTRWPFKEAWPPAPGFAGPFPEVLELKEGELIIQSTSFPWGPSAPL